MTMADSGNRSNQACSRSVNRYNAQRHRHEAHSRLDEWIAKLPADGLREMCTWEQFCRFARTPERRKVGDPASGPARGVGWSGFVRLY